MKPSTRIIFNTSIQYVRTVISVLVTLYTARLILDALGVEDYGIYSLVGGIVAMLSFVQTSLTSTTQAYIRIMHIATFHFQWISEYSGRSGKCCNLGILLYVIYIVFHHAINSLSGCSDCS